MNILYISSKKNWGGVVSLMVRTALALEKRGHTVWIISARHSALTRRAPRGLRLVPRVFGMDYNPVMIGTLVSFIKKNHIDLAVVNIKKEIIAGGIAAKLSGVPCVRLIGNERDFLKTRGLHGLIKASICPCHSTKETALARFPWLSGNTLHVIHNGLNSKSYTRNEIRDQRKMWGVKTGSVVLGVTGRLVRSKGIGFMIRTFDRISRKCPESMLVITGKGKHQEEFMELIRELGLERRVILAGFSPDPLLAAASYDIGILPSDFEAFPFAVVEYMASGTPVIASRVGGTAEIVQEGTNGYLIEPRNEDQLMDRAVKMIRDEKLRKKLGKAARETIEKSFTEDGMISQFENCYGEITRS